MIFTRYKDGSYRESILFRIILLLYVVSWNPVVPQYRQRTINNVYGPYRSQINRNPPTSRNSVRYSELQALKADCYPKDTCSVLRSKDDIMDSFCQCGRVCNMLDTCCVDSRYKALTRTPYGTKHRCQVVFGKYPPNAFMVDKCKRNWSGEDYFKQMCTSSAESQSDPLLYIPGTNTKTRATYRNLYCALCNDEDVKNLVFWNLHMFVRDETGSLRKVDPTELPKLRYHNGTFDGPRTEYPGWKLDEKGGDVYFNMEIPPRLEPFVVMCPPRDVISTCASDWTDGVVAQKCASYMAIVVSIDWNKRYRNVHCALCNNIGVDNLTCKSKTDADPGEAGRTPFNLGLLLDVNPSTGPLVGIQRKCKENHIYHPTKQICIRLAGCFIGHELKNGQCVRKKKP